MPCLRNAVTPIRAIFLLGAFVATPAFALTADLSVAVTSPTKAINFGADAKFTIVVTNAGPNHATGVTLNATFPTGLGTGASATNCTPTGTDPFPCVVQGEFPTAGEIIDGESVTVVVTAPSDVPDTSGSCPATNAVGDTTFTVSSTSTDPVTTNNAGTGTVTVKPFAELSADVTGPASAKVGDTITYTLTAKNLGPCPAPNVGYLADTPSPFLSFVSDSLNSKDDCPGGGSDGTCVNVMSASLAPGATTSVDVKYKVTGLPSEVNGTQVNMPHEFTVTSDLNDPGSAGVTAATTPVEMNKAGGCNSTGSAGGLLSLALMAVAALRRRKA